MKSLLFFDDWLLHRRDGLERQWNRPTFVKELFKNFYPGVLGYGGYMTAFHDAKVGRYVMYLNVYPHEADPGTFVVRLESDDPRNWPAPRFTPGISPIWKGFSNVVTDQDGKRFWAYAVTPLAGTPQADKGYVASQWYRMPEYETYVRQLKATGGVGEFHPPNSAEGRGVIGFSPDGLRFHMDRERPFRHFGADDSGNFLWSPQLGKYVIKTRRVDNDRRVVQCTTEDFESFSPLMTVIQADALDGLGIEFYDMPSRPYEDMFVGFLHVLATDPDDKSRIKMVGRMTTQLAHSYNGFTWVRPNREPFLPVREYGEQGGGQVYGMEMIRTRDDRLLFLAHASYGEHGAYPAMQTAGLDTTGYFNALLYEMRLDGFCSLRTRSRDGLLETKTLVPQGSELSLNIQTTTHTAARVELRDGLTLDPIPGYTFADAVPISGDHLFAPVRWKDHADLGSWIGKPIRIAIQMQEAELFAIRLRYKAYYAQVGTPPIASLA